MRKKENKTKEMIKTDSSTSGRNIMYDDLKNTVFDWDGLLYRLMGDEDLAREIVDDFMKDIPGKYSALKQALKKQDALLVKREAHIIKGASGNVGAVALQEIAEQIETAGGAEDLAKAELYTEKFEALLEILKENIHKF